MTLRPGSVRRRAGGGHLRRVVLLLCSTGASLALLEVGARVEYRLATGEAFPAAATRERLGAAGDPDLVLRGTGEDADAEPDLVANKALHPYTGFVHDHAGAPKSTNRFGFPGFDPLTPPAGDEVRVVVTGGSVALQLFKEGGRRLREDLAALPAFAGRKIRLIALTLGGYKQPQQLLSFAWFLSLGAHFDVVINLDGFNEVVLPYSDNVPEGVHPSFPRSWQLYARKSLDDAEIDRLLAVRATQSERSRWRARLGTGLLAESVFVLRVLDFIDHRLAEDLAEADGALRKQLAAHELPYQVTGPKAEYASEAALFAELVALWRESSLQMHRLAAANGIDYFHFLQPNQYVEGSKRLSEAELRQAIRPGRFAPKTAVRAAYGALAAAGKELRGEGVQFVDLTQVFAAEPETVYRDSCCHLNRRGVDALADRIAEAVSRELPAREDARSSPREGGRHGG